MGNDVTQAGKDELPCFNTEHRHIKQIDFTRAHAPELIFMRWKWRHWQCRDKNKTNFKFLTFLSPQTCLLSDGFFFLFFFFCSFSGLLNGVVVIAMPPPFPQSSSSRSSSPMCILYKAENLYSRNWNKAKRTEDNFDPLRYASMALSANAWTKNFTLKALSL